MALENSASPFPAVILAGLIPLGWAKAFPRNQRFSPNKDQPFRRGREKTCIESTTLMTNVLTEINIKLIHEIAKCATCIIYTIPNAYIH
jgi:hypothetical protein